MGGLKRKILIIDDEAVVRDFFARTLEPGGFEVVGVANPEEGIEKAKQILPDIIYMSLLFPGSNGLKAGKALHSVDELKAIPIVLLTSYEGELDPKYTKTIGIVDVLVSPLKAAHVLAMTAKLLGEEISVGSGGLPRSGEVEIEVPPPVDDNGFHVEGGGSEGVAEGSRPSDAVVQEKSFEMPDEMEDKSPPSHRHAGSASRRDDYEDFMAGGEEEEGEGFPGGPAEVQEDEGGKPSAEKDSPGYSEGGGYNDEDFFEAHEETGKSSKLKYVLFAVLVLLVAAAVFAALQTGIFRRGGAGTSSSVVKKKAVMEERTGQAVKPAKGEGNKKSAAVEAGKQGQEEDKAPPPSPTAEQKVKPVAKVPSSPPKAEKKIAKKAVKGHGNLKGQHKEIYSVQTGAFGSKGNAVSFAEKLKKRGYDAFVEKDSRAGLYRVLVGRFDSYGKALRRSKVLLRKDGIRSLVYHR